MRPATTIRIRKRRNSSQDARVCAGKARWKWEEAAQRAITRWRREYPDAFDSTVRPYRCGLCKHFHIGHPR